uniref:Uncharacterized protein n=1 Tax=Acrobeloides nanus TaxID=290746 RepID=A0A914CSP4_9BILA
MYVIYCVFFIWIVYRIYRYFLEKTKLESIRGRYVLVTGCDSGFGRLLIKRLLAHGLNVFAGCYTLEGEESLKSECEKLDGQLYTINLDITSQKSVDTCYDYVKTILEANEADLWALVNNAGFCAIYGPNDWITSEEYELSIGVNLMGAIRVTQKFVHLLRKSKGRIVTMISASGRIHGFYTAPYATAKYGLQGYMDSLRLELHPFGVTCHVLEPGGFRTTFVSPEAMDARVESVWGKLSSEIKEEYGYDFKENFKESWKKGIELVGSFNLDEVVNAYMHALTANYPKYRYICGWDAKL